MRCNTIVLILVTSVLYKNKTPNLQVTLLDCKEFGKAHNKIGRIIGRKLLVEL